MNYYYLLLLICLMVLINSCKNITNYADYTNKSKWSHHYAYGSPSWDQFERYDNNPVHKGHEGLEWPVNGFLFNDPISQNWYMYVAEYAKSYGFHPLSKDRNCLIYKSSDKGKTWEEVGDLFPFGMIAYDSVSLRVPDVMVTYEDNKYHLIFDWRSKYANWKDMSMGGIGYAVSDSPEGPFLVSDKPLKINTQYKENLLLGRYWRMYAPMIFKRKNDWAIAYMMDDLPAWCLAISTADNPEGPYSDPKIVLNVERKTYFQPLQEFYPAFEHNEYAYFPSSSVSINRNFQSLWRVKIEEMTEPDKYELVEDGSLWHSENVENEYYGIWGQTFTGFIDEYDSIYVMYPSKNSNDIGTINLAKSSWHNLHRKNGFWLTANMGKTFSYIKKTTNIDHIKIGYKLEGEMKIIWDFNMPIDVQNFWGKFDLENDYSEYKEIIIGKDNWAINFYTKNKGINYVASGTLPSSEGESHILSIENEKGQYVVNLDNKTLWEGELQKSSGLVGVLLSEHSYVFIDNFVVNGEDTNEKVVYGFHDAIVAAGSKPKNWNIKNDSIFLYGNGAVSTTKSSHAKWNFEGRSFELFLPKGTKFGTVKVYLDGKFLDDIQLFNPEEIKSAMVYRSEYFDFGKHAVFIESNDGLLPVDCIKVNF